MHPLSGALPLPYVPARVIRGALVAHRHSCAEVICTHLRGDLQHLRGNLHTSKK